MCHPLPESYIEQYLIIYKHVSRKENFLKFNSMKFSLYGHTSPALGSGPLTQAT